MVEPSSRRSFLFGRHANAEDDWSKFVVTLRRACKGTVKLVANQQAHLHPRALDDVIEARKLCQAHGVVMALEGLALPSADQAGFVLWVEAGSAWGSLIPLGDTGLWRVDAGCSLAVMQAAGLVSDPINPQMTNLAQWFASVYRYECLPHDILREHLISVDWLLPDGTIEVFGTFGANDAQPLGSLAAQKLVPRLFEISMNEQVRDAIGQDPWPSCFHLDALTDVNDVNLAHFFVGHGGSLGWLVAATFRKTNDMLQANTFRSLSDRTRFALDEQVKSIVDPDKVFMSPLDQTR